VSCSEALPFRQNASAPQDGTGAAGLLAICRQCAPCMHIQATTCDRPQRNLPAAGRLECTHGTDACTTGPAARCRRTYRAPPLCAWLPSLSRISTGGGRWVDVIRAMRRGRGDQTDLTSARTTRGSSRAIEAPGPAPRARAYINPRRSRSIGHPPLH
jgi:hypothetical protein